MIYTKEEFKEKWEHGYGEDITFGDFADCAEAWGLYSRPRTHDILKVSNAVLVAAGCEKYFREEDEDEDQD